MKRYLPVFFCFFIALIFVLNPQLSLAQQTDQSTEPAESGMIAPDFVPRPPERKPLPFAGQDHKYSVILRGNGEAVITLKVALTNTYSENTDLSQVALRLPLRITPSDIAVYQIIAQGYCTRYEERVYTPGVSSYYSPRCMEYSEPDYYNYYGGGKYQRARYIYSGDTLLVTLPVPISPENTGAFFVYFRAIGYAKRNLAGAYKFDFETLKTNSSINQLNIGISTDSDLYLKGAKGQVEYRVADTSAIMKMEAGAAAPMANSAIDRVVSQIGQGTIVKTASNLAPLESYKVSGMYANSRLKLYGKEILTALAIVLVILAIIFLVIRKILGLFAPVAVKKTVASDVKKQENARLFLTSFGIAFVSSVILAGYSLLLLIVFSYLNYGYYDYQLAQLLRMGLIIFSFCIYSVGLFIPGIYFGYKRGMGWGVLTVVLTVGWLFFYLFIGAVIIFFFGYQQRSAIVPMMQNLQK